MMMFLRRSNGSRITSMTWVCFILPERAATIWIFSRYVGRDELSASKRSRAASLKDLGERRIYWSPLYAEGERVSRIGQFHVFIPRATHRMI